MSFPVSKAVNKNPRKSRAQKATKGFRPQLTSLVDVMTILLIYLLKSFSSEGEIVTMSKDLDLPESSARKRPELTVVLTVNNQYILAENRLIVNTDKALASEEIVIPELYNWLGNRRVMTEKIEQFNTRTAFTGDITIQADKRIHFRLLKKIMYTCGQQGYNNFSLAVRKREE